MPHRRPGHAVAIVPRRPACTARWSRLQGSTLRHGAQLVHEAAHDAGADVQDLGEGREQPGCGAGGNVWAGVAVWPRSCTSHLMMCALTSGAWEKDGTPKTPNFPHFSPAPRHLCFRSHGSQLLHSFLLPRSPAKRPIRRSQPPHNVHPSHTSQLPHTPHLPQKP